jgi:protein-disulfide isomerase
LPIAFLFLLSALRCAPVLAEERPVLATGREHDVLVGAPEPLPALGPRHALVTVDLFLPMGAPPSASLFALVQRVLPDEPEVRVVFHPVVQGFGPAGTWGQRGLEVAWEAWAQGRFWQACGRLLEQPDLLAPEREAALIEEARALGLDEARLQQALSERRHRIAVQGLVRRHGELSLLLPEVWVNGQRLRPGASEVQLRDEIVRQRARARALQRQGVPLPQLYDRLLGPGQRLSPQGAPSPRQRRVWLDLRGAPSRGPEIAPVTLVLFGSFASTGTASYARLARQAQESFPGRVKVVIKHLPSGIAGNVAAFYLAWLGRNEADREVFWTLHDRLTQRAEESFQLSIRDVQRLVSGLGRRGLPPEPVDGPVMDLLKKDRADAARLGVDSAPALLVNGQLLRGSLSMRTLEPLLRRELEMGLVQRLRGAQ